MSKIEFATPVLITDPQKHCLNPICAFLKTLQSPIEVLLESDLLRHRSFQITLTNCQLLVEVRLLAMLIEIHCARKSRLISVLLRAKRRHPFTSYCRLLPPREISKSF
jgi:hypothetical protein